MPMPMTMPMPTTTTTNPTPVDRHLMPDILRALLATADQGTPFRRPDGVTDADIVALARHHRLSPLLGIGTRPAGFSEVVAETFRRDRLSTLGRSTLLRHGLLEILKAFDAEGIDVAVLKGIAYEDLIYPDLGTRPSSDIDLLVPEGERRAVLQTLVRLGYAPSAAAPGFDEPDYHEISFRRDAVNVDLHFALAPLVRCSIDYAQVWNDMRRWNFSGRMTKTLSFVHAAVNQALHMAIHHFDVPAIYMLDFRRLVAQAEGASETAVAGRPVREAHIASRDPLRDAARAWGCRRPLETTLALTGAFLAKEGGAGGPEVESRRAAPRGSGGARLAGPAFAWSVGRIVEGFGGLEPVPRPEQLARKILQFDDPGRAGRYLLVQGRRILRERWLTRSGKARSAAERLGLSTAPPSVSSRSASH